jgi:predicted ATP-binding protein involved in virulence
MYLKRFRIERVKCFESVELHFPHDRDDFAGWVVLLGGNGTGKSTLLQAMALTLIGPLAGQRLLQPHGWVLSGAAYGELTAEIVKGEQDSQLGQPRKKPYEVHFAVTGGQTVELDGQPYDQPQLVHLADPAKRKALASGPYASRRPGWFCCGYGPFRRLSGGDAAEAKLVYSQGVEARFATLFRESAALTMCQDWLTQLYSRSIDPSNAQKDQSRQDFETVRKVIDHLLPGDVRVEKIDTTMVYFRTIGGAVVPVPDLSDGYRSFLALAVDMLRHVVEANLDLSSLVQTTAEGVQVTVAGIVLIDEADAHLHPLWQRSIGFQLRRVFPRIQFIVTTHSPFVAQAATDDGLLVLRPGDTGRVGVVRPLQTVKGWRADQILTSPLFGLSGTRDLDTERLLREQRDLAAKREWDHMSEAEQQRLAQLEDELARRVTAPGESLEERTRQEEMRRYVEKTLQRIGEEP